MSQSRVVVARTGDEQESPAAGQGLAALSRRGVLVMTPALALLTLAGTGTAEAATAAEIDRDARNALDRLYRSTPPAKILSDKAKGILVFPSIIKGGFVVGGQYGQGALMEGGKTVAYYNIVAGSIGWQIGAQSFSQAWFFMTDKALQYLDKSFRLRGRGRRHRGRGRRRQGRRSLQHHAAEPHHRFCLRPVRPDGGPLAPGLEGHADPSELAMPAGRSARRGGEPGLR